MAAATILAALIGVAVPTHGFGLFPANGKRSPTSNSGHTLPVAAASRSLLGMTAVDLGNFQRGPQRVNSHLYQKTLYETFTDFGCGDGMPDHITYNLLNRYRHFQAMVGLADKSPAVDKVQFSLVVNGQRRVASPTLVLGQIKVIDVNIAGASQITLADVCTSRPPQLSNDITAVWINPVVTP